jgi:hypothetical protein
MTVDASTKANWKLLRTTFKAWREDAVSARLASRIDHRRLQKSFSFWVVRQRGVLLERVRDQRFLQEALDIWRERYEGIQEVLDSTLEVVETTRSNKLLRTSFRIWKENVAIREEEHDLACVRFHSTRRLPLGVPREITTSKVSEDMEGIKSSKNPVDARG